jgi:hypothetical protein
MTSEQKAAYIYSQTVCALAEIEGMKAANEQKAYDGFGPTYREKDFMAMIVKWGISPKTVSEFFKE